MKKKKSCSPFKRVYYHILYYVTHRIVGYIIKVYIRWGGGGEAISRENNILSSRVNIYPSVMRGFRYALGFSSSSKRDDDDDDDALGRLTCPS